MTDVIDLDARRNPIDPEHVCRDMRTDRVDTMYRFLASYEFDGDTWDVEIWARDFAEAERGVCPRRSEVGGAGGRDDRRLTTLRG